MVRRYSKKTKSNRKSNKCKNTTITEKKKSHCNNEITLHSTDTELDYTLPDGNHLDSFDKIRSDEHK